MRVKNTGNKLVLIGDITLMPGEEVAIANTIAQAESIQLLAKYGELQISDETVVNKRTAAKEIADANSTSTDDIVTDKSTKPAKKPRKNTAKAK